MELKQVDYQCADGAGNVLSYYQCDSELAVLCLPALGMRAEKYHAILRAFSTQGLSVASVDLRGNGHSSLRPSRSIDFGYHEQIEYELPAAIDALFMATGCKSVVIFGHSIGAHIALLGQCHKDVRVKAIIVCASGTVYFRNWPLFLSPIILLMMRLVKLISFIFGHYPGQYFGFGGKEAKRIMSDFAHTGVTGEFSFGHSDRQFSNELSELKTLVLAINFENDWYAPIKGTEHLLSFLPKAHIERKSFNKYQLNLKTASHFSWMKRPNAITAEVVRWLKKHSIHD